MTCEYFLCTYPTGECQNFCDEKKGTGSNTYEERQTVRNVAEFLFEYYCAEKEYKITRVGFDEKRRNVDNFYRLNPFLRNLPDYIVNTPKNTFVVNVKGTGNFKQKEIELLPKFIEWYGSAEAQLIYAFCFTGKKPIMLSPEEILEKYSKANDKQWTDGVIYRNLGLTND